MRAELRTVLAVAGLFNILFFVYPGPLVSAANPSNARPTACATMPQLRGVRIAC